MKRLMNKTISLLLLLAFFADTCCYGLATLPASNNPRIKREILATLNRTQIRYAESEDAIKLLKANNASCLLLSSGKYLVTKEVAQNDTMLLRAIIHEDIEAIMQILMEEGRRNKNSKYQGIKELILKYFPPPTGSDALEAELYANHAVARALEWLFLLENKIIVQNEISQEEADFIRTIRPIIMSNKHNYFTSEFWDSGERGKKIRQALNNGTRFYQVANEKFALKKCIVLDCDGILWGGIVGEDGVEGIVLNEHYMVFQRKLLDLKNSGVILALNSKNDISDVRAVFKAHPEMPLKWEDFVAMRINWQDKEANIKEIAKELDIGMDTMVFIDDTPQERAIILQMLPEVLVPDMPKDASKYAGLLDELQVFAKNVITAEDRLRTEMYVSRQKRKELYAKSVSKEDFLKNLELKVIVREAAEDDVSRVAQITQRTTQFNLTGEHYTEAEIRDFIKDRWRTKVYIIKVSDKFGDAGTVGIMVLKDVSVEDYIVELEILNLCLSCRVLGLGIERAFMANVMSYLKKDLTRGADIVWGRYIPTGKNDLARDLYADLGFIKYTGGIKGTPYKLDPYVFEMKVPEWIEVVGAEKTTDDKNLAVSKPTNIGVEPHNAIYRIYPDASQSVTSETTEPVVRSCGESYDGLMMPELHISKKELSSLADDAAIYRSLDILDYHDESIADRDSVEHKYSWRKTGRCSLNNLESHYEGKVDAGVIKNSAKRPSLILEEIDKDECDEVGWLGTRTTVYVVFEDGSRSSIGWWEITRNDKGTHISRGSIDEIVELHPALNKAANEGRIFAVMPEQVDALRKINDTMFIDLLVANLTHLRSPPETKNKLYQKIRDPKFKENIIRGFILMRDSIKDNALPIDKPTRLCIVVEDENLPTIIFKDSYNNLIAHVGKGHKTGMPYISIYTGYNVLEVGLKTGVTSALKDIVAHEARDAIRGYHKYEETEAVRRLYVQVLHEKNRIKDTDRNRMIDILQNETNVARALWEGDLIKRVFPFICFLEEKDENHVKNVVHFVKTIVSGDYAGFILNKAGVDGNGGISNSMISKYTELAGRFINKSGEDPKRRKELLYLSALLHDVGKAIKRDGHNETGADFMTQIFSMLRKNGFSYNADEEELITYAVRLHDCLGNLFYLERLPQWIINALPKETEKREDVFALMAIITLCDVRELGNGERLIKEKVDFYIDKCNLDQLERDSKNGNLWIDRIKELATQESNGKKCADSAQYEREIDQILSSLDSATKKDLEIMLSNRITVFEYGFYIFNALGKESRVGLINLLILISKICKNEFKEHYEIKCALKYDYKLNGKDRIEELRIYVTQLNNSLKTMPSKGVTYRVEGNKIGLDLDSIIVEKEKQENIDVFDHDLYDTESAVFLLSDLLYTQLHKDRAYEIKYDTFRLTTSQIEIIEEYVRLLQLRSLNPDSIKLRPFSSAQGSRESLIAVYCTGKDYKGEGHVDVVVPDGELKDYLLKITGMVNIALASSNIPDNLSKEDVDKYRPIMSYIKNQYKTILGEELAIPDSPEDILKVIRQIVLGLPKSLRMNIERIEEFNKLAREALIAA